MRYRSLHIIAILIAFFMLSSDSCESQVEEVQKRKKERFHQSIETIKEGFESDYLTETARIAYEEKAKQKLVDFSDYFTFYSDKTIDTLFRKKTGEMMLALFYQNESMLDFKMDIAEKRIRRDTEELLKKLQQTDYDALLLTAESVQTFSASERINENTYLGKLSYLHSLKGITGNDTTLIERIPMQAEFYIKKVNKNIGKEPKKIWKVFLGKIKAF